VLLSVLMVGILNSSDFWLFVGVVLLTPVTVASCLRLWMMDSVFFSLRKKLDNSNLSVFLKILLRCKWCFGLHLTWMTLLGGWFFPRVTIFWGLLHACRYIVGRYFDISYIPSYLEPPLFSLEDDPAHMDLKRLEAEMKYWEEIPADELNQEQCMRYKMLVAAKFDVEQGLGL